MQYLKATHKVFDSYAALIGDNVYILTTGEFITLAGMRVYGEKPQEISDEDQGAVVAVAQDVYDRAGHVSSYLISMDESLASLGEGARMVYDDEDDRPGTSFVPLEPNTMVSLTATASVGGMLAHEISPDFYILDDGKLFRKRGDRVPVLEATGTFEVAVENYTFAKNKDKARKILLDRDQKND